jgi:small GTP-binding protein
MASENIPSISIKLILLGNTNVGKTSLALAYSGKKYSQYVHNTIGVDYHSRKTITDNHSVKLYIWDMAGQERFRTLVKAYYRGAHCAMVVFDKSNRESFKQIGDWIYQMQLGINLPHEHILLVGNKSDLTPEVFDDDINSLLKNYEGIKYLETSIWDLNQINNSFDALISNCIKNKSYTLNQRPARKVGMSVIDNDGEEIQTPAPGACCVIL